MGSNFHSKSWVYDVLENGQFSMHTKISFIYLQGLYMTIFWWAYVCIEGQAPLRLFQQLYV